MSKLKQMKDLDKHLLVFCPKCDTYKFCSDFHYIESKRNGCYSYCKKCRKTIDAARYQKKKRDRFMDEISDVFVKYGVPHTAVMHRRLIGAYEMGWR